MDNLKNALRNNTYTKLTPRETAKHRNEFDKVRDKLIKELEEKTGQTWATYTVNGGTYILQNFLKSINQAYMEQAHLRIYCLKEKNRNEIWKNSK